MIDEIKVEHSVTDLGRTEKYVASFDRLGFLSLLPRMIFELIAKSIAERYVVENYTEIAKHIDARAIATLSVAQGAIEVSNAIKETQPPTVIREQAIEVFQRGILGGLKRVR